MDTFTIDYDMYASAKLERLKPTAAQILEEMFT